MLERTPARVHSPAAAMASVLGTSRASGGLSGQLKCKSKRRRRRRAKRKGKDLLPRRLSRTLRDARRLCLRALPASSGLPRDAGATWPGPAERPAPEFRSLRERPGFRKPEGVANQAGSPRKTVPSAASGTAADRRAQTPVPKETLA